MLKSKTRWTVNPSFVTRLCLLTLLIASATACKTIAVPPDDYLQDCRISYLGGSRGSASSMDRIVKLAEARGNDTRLCNVDKAALRAWKADVCKGGSVRCVDGR